MDPSRRQGRPEEEMFLQKPSNADPDTPTVGPLRINKFESASPPPRAGSAGSANGSISRPPPLPSFPMPPVSPPPNAPLPYPDDRLRQQPAAGRAYTPLSERERTAKNATPELNRAEEGRRRRSSATRPEGSPRARFAADDPNRPTVSGYGTTPAPQTSEGVPITGRLGDTRGGTPKPRPESPVRAAADNDGLFQRAPQRPGGSVSSASGTTAVEDANPNPYPDYHQQYWPPPSTTESKGPGLKIPNPGGVNRIGSTASISTTKAQRGSPPPPETPIVPPPGGGIEARYAAAGIAGSSTLDSFQTQNLAAAQRAQPYASSQSRPGASPPPQNQPYQQPQQPQQPPARPWTPTEQPGSQPFGAPAVYQGPNEVLGSGTLSQSTQQRQSPPTAQPYQSPPAAQPFQSPPAAQPYQSPPVQAQATAPTQPAAPPSLEQDMHRMNLHEEAPPAYSSLHHPPGASNAQGYPNEKRNASITSSGPNTLPGAALMADSNIQQHPAFANERNQQQPQYPQQQQYSQQTQPQQPGAAGTGPTPQPAQTGLAPVQIQPTSSPGPGPGPGPASPPPLPEGWIAHLDPNSGHYYYIHLQTQSTQWEFPKGPTPLNLNEPMSPTGSFVNPLASPGLGKFGGQPLASPGFPPQQATYPDAMVGMAGLSSPTAGSFTGPPPVAGVDMYKIAPTNGVYFGPYLRYTNMDIERGLWLGSILLITDAPQPPTIHIHQSVDLSPNPRQLKANPIFSHQRWLFYRYDIDLRMEDDHEAKWTYAITSHLGCTRYEFLVAGRHQTNWRFITHSGNDFALNVSAAERQKLGGVGFMWKDVLQKHIDVGGFHCQLGLGDQIYADRLWKEIPLLKQWTAMSGKENRKNAPWTAKHEEDVSHAYFHYYTSHFDQPHLREAFAQIPHILCLDDHDIFDGYGSYPDYMQQSHIFKSIGRIGIEMYLLFQHHTTHEILRSVSTDTDLFTITGTGWHFLKYLGPSVVVVGPDTRSERTPHQVMAGPTYQGLFPKVAMLPPSVQHCLWMIPVPVVYPRLESFEHLAHTVATGKKAVTGTFNMLGKVTSSVAGVVGAKSVVGDGFSSVKKAVGKTGLMSGILSPFGEIDVLDELRDQWTHESKDLERTYLIRTLQGIAHNKSLRMTFISGDVSLCGAGLLHDPSRPSDHKTIYQIITSPIVNTPAPSFTLRLLHNNKPLYVPANGHRSTHQVSDTKEDMMEIFAVDVDGRQREYKRLMGRRNYGVGCIFDPEIVMGTFGQANPGHGSGRLSISIEFMVQNEGVYGQPVKYGPVVVPSLEYGR